MYNFYGSFQTGIRQSLSVIYTLRNSLNLTQLFQFFIMKTKLIAFISCVCWSLSGAALDASRLSDDLYIYGFGTLAAVYNSDDNVDFIRTQEQSQGRYNRVNFNNDSRIGLHLNYQPNGVVGAEAQALVRYGLGNHYELLLSTATLKFKFGNRWQGRLGKFPYEGFYRADSVLAGYSYLWARPPVEFYNFNILSSIDGASISHSLHTRSGKYTARLYGGWVSTDISTSKDIDKLNVGHSPVHGITLEFSRHQWSLSASWSELEVDEIPERFTPENQIPEETPGFDTLINLLGNSNPAGFKSEYVSLGTSYEPNNWRFTAAVGRVFGDGNVLPDKVDWYTSVGYRFNQLTPYLLLSGSKSDSIPSISLGISPETDRALNRLRMDTQSDQMSLGIGARYELTTQAFLKMQYDRIDSDANPSFLWTNEDPDWDGDTNLFTIGLDFTF